MERLQHVPHLQSLATNDDPDVKDKRRRANQVGPLVLPKILFSSLAYQGPSLSKLRCKARREPLE